MEQVARVVRFAGREIGYDDAVLTPRPWTEAQARWGRELLADLPAGAVLEVCAGAGHIGLLTVVETDRRLVQVDADAHACRWARRNAREWGVDSDVRHGSMVEAVREPETFVLVIADPPWVPSERVPDFPDDPVTAIDGGDDGLEVARMCLDVMARHLDARGVGLLQLRDEEQGRDLAADARSRGLRIVESRDFGGGAVVLIRRTAASA